jgi:hypothetical protein
MLKTVAATYNPRSTSLDEGLEILRIQTAILSGGFSYFGHYLQKG